MTGSNACKSSSTHHRHQRQQQQPQQLQLQQFHLTSPTVREKHTVHWFRKGLRLHDNPAFSRGVQGSKTFRCVFIIDPWFAGCSNVGINKWRFLLQCLEDLDSSLKKLNSRLFVIRGQPADALPKLFKKWGTTCFTFEEDPEPFGKVRDQKIQQLCNELNIDVIQAVSHTLYKLESIIERNGGQAPLTYNQFQGIIAAMDSPVMAEPAISQEHIANAVTPTSEDHDEKFGVPTLLELGFDTDNLLPPTWIGGETEALARLEGHLERKAWVASFGKPKMTPQSLLPSQTGLSPYLRFGCLSTRLFYHQLTDLYKKIKKSCPPLSLHGQLLWREFFYCAATKNSNFDKMEHNPICVQIPWQRNPTALAKWANGHTGFPWIDAIMTQLRYEGWIHHLARHAVACFLTRGDLWISWEEGMKVFEELLLDADWSVNAGTWMWLSCSSFFQQFFHCYCPVKFGRKADPNGDYIRRYLPVLKNFPTAYIHEPWHAPEDVQRTSKCIVGRDYPLPIVNHVNASRTNMKRLKQVYNQLNNYQKEETIVPAKSKTFIMNVSTPSPNTIVSNVNNSGQYMCQMNNNSMHQSTTSLQHLSPQQHPLHPQYHRSTDQHNQPLSQQHRELSPSLDHVTYTNNENPQLYHENCVPKMDFIETQYKAPIIAIEYPSVPSVSYNQYILHCSSGPDTIMSRSSDMLLRPTVNPGLLIKYQSETTSVGLQPYHGVVPMRLATTTSNTVDMQLSHQMQEHQFQQQQHHQLQDQQQLMQQLNLLPASHQRQQYLNQRVLQQSQIHQLPRLPHLHRQQPQPIFQSLPAMSTRHPLIATLHSTPQTSSVTATSASSPATDRIALTTTASKPAFTTIVFKSSNTATESVGLTATQADIHLKPTTSHSLARTIQGSSPESVDNRTAEEGLMVLGNPQPVLCAYRASARR